MAADKGGQDQREQEAPTDAGSSALFSNVSAGAIPQFSPPTGIPDHPLQVEMQLLPLPLLLIWILHHREKISGMMDTTTNHVLLYFMQGL